MANIQERRNKDGQLISFSIRVHRGRGADGKQLKPYTATFDVEPTWKEETARKKAAAPRQRTELFAEILKALRSAAYKRSRFPAHYGKYAILQRC